VALPVSLGAARSLLKELRVSAEDDRPLVVGGARELAEVLRRELVRGGSPAAVRVGDPEGAALYVHVLGREPSEEDEQALKRARRARVPIVAVAAGPVADDLHVPFVLATDVVRVPLGSGFPVEEIAVAIARKLGEEATPLAARLPVLRGAVCAQLVESFARKNAVVAAAVFVPGADLPLLTLNQLRLALRIAATYGEEMNRERLPEALAVVAASFGLRTVARELLDLVPFAGWALKGAVAYAGTKAVGEAAIRAAEARHPARHAR
jgi:uncharacterized protein (DUF697 family)